MSKQCTRCGQTKTFEAFGFRGKLKSGAPRVRAWCKQCLNAYNREKRRTSAAARSQNRAICKAAIERLKGEVASLKNGQPCSDCGRKYAHWIMQFDHVRGQKIGDVSTLMCHGARNKLYEEIEKCELVCANCHADRTYKRRNNQAPGVRLEE